MPSTCIQDPLGSPSLVSSIVWNSISTYQNHSLSNFYPALPPSFSSMTTAPQVGGQEVGSNVQNRGVGALALIKFSVCRVDDISSMSPLSFVES